MPFPPGSYDPNRSYTASIELVYDSNVNFSTEVSPISELILRVNGLFEYTFVDFDTPNDVGLDRQHVAIFPFLDENDVVQIQSVRDRAPGVLDATLVAEIFYPFNSITTYTAQELAGLPIENSEVEFRFFGDPNVQGQPATVFNFNITAAASGDDIDRILAAVPSPAAFGAVGLLLPLMLRRKSA